MKWQLESNKIKELKGNSYLKIGRFTKEHIKQFVFTLSFTVDFRPRWYLVENNDEQCCVNVFPDR